jgi:hypothetical protein
MELSGNLWEPTVTVGSQVGRRFEATHGDGSAAYPEGWRFITTGGRRDSGSSFRRRGGSFGRNPHHVGSLRTSDRWGGVLCGAFGLGLRGHQRYSGFRCVRSAPAE